ncbi:hypothetical protein [Crystallibacter degradans]|uniref:hypothetical protein n=1 Tax=Crystallibacter degradans TaxID=2726743 RepID=UPI001475ED3E|nr:hypothetical protein [Arthrobacter sp. SF27]NMR29384.1 hypothetical protein [Arthrobacter sp. SF27]
MNMAHDLYRVIGREIINGEGWDTGLTGHPPDQGRPTEGLRRFPAGDDATASQDHPRQRGRAPERLAR